MYSRNKYSNLFQYSTKNPDLLTVSDYKLINIVVTASFIIIDINTFVVAVAVVGKHACWLLSVSSGVCEINMAIK